MVFCRISSRYFGGIGAQEESSELRNKLELLQADGQWGEVVLVDGGVCGQSTSNRR